MSDAAGHVVAIIQARMGSTRLPGQSLEVIEARPLLLHVVDRARAATLIDDVWIATTTQPEDDRIAETADSNGVAVYRGSVEDVLDRYVGAARAAAADTVVRLTADDPLKDPQIIDKVVRALIEGSHVDYASNTLEPTYPEGLDVEVFARHTLERASREAALPSEREHVTPYIWKHPEIFRLVSIKDDIDRSHMRWTVDYPADLEFVRAVYGELYHGEVFSSGAVLELLARHPGLMGVVEPHERNEGYRRSVGEEQSVDQ